MTVDERVELARANVILLARRVVLGLAKVAALEEALRWYDDARRWQEEKPPQDAA